jgi:hypothetical protein
MFTLTAVHFAIQDGIPLYAPALAGVWVAIALGAALLVTVGLMAVAAERPFRWRLRLPVPSPYSRRVLGAN